jgi:hypothetical protein
MAGENAQSRIYLGIHWEFDAVEGIRSGDEIADYVYTHALTPRCGPQLVPLPSLDPRAQIDLAVWLEVVAANGGLGTGYFWGTGSPPAFGATLDASLAAALAQGSTMMDTVGKGQVFRAQAHTVAGDPLPAPAPMGQAIRGRPDFGAAVHHQTEEALESPESWFTIR